MHVEPARWFRSNSWGCVALSAVAWAAIGCSSGGAPSMDPGAAPPGTTDPGGGSVGTPGTTDPGSTDTPTGVEPGTEVPLASTLAYTVTLKTVIGGNFVSAEMGGGGDVNANRTVADEWETFTLRDLDAGELKDGDLVTLAAMNGQYLCAEDGGGGAVLANRTQALDWETFTLHRVAGAGTIADGDQITISTKSKGLYLSAVNGGGGALTADREVASGWETFVLGVSGGVVTPPSGGGGTVSGLRVVAYLPNYSGSYADWAKKIDFTKMTHLNLAFALATGSNGWDMGASDADVKALVDAAHAKGVKVLASLGGGGGDQTVIARFKNAANIGPLTDNLDAFLTKHGFDGADIDIEDGNNLGANYSQFVAAVVAKLRPEGKLVTAACAQYLQGAMSDDTLHSFDFVNVMIYSNYNDSVNAMTYYSQTKKVPKAQLTLGAGFFGTDSSYAEYSYADIMRADPDAWSKDSTTVNGKTVSYTGVASMQKLVDYSKGFGGIMFWELSEDASSHSLWKTIQDRM